MTQEQKVGWHVGLSALLDGWLPIETAPKDGTMVLVNDTTPGWTPWVAASYHDGGERPRWVYDDATAADSNPLGPQPTHWLPVPPLPSNDQAHRRQWSAAELPSGAAPC